jgi:hypothetical protein
VLAVEAKALPVVQAKLAVVDTSQNTTK